MRVSTMKHLALLLLLLALALLPACQSSSSSSGGGDDTDTGTVTDMDTDVDTDSDTDSDTDTELDCSDLEPGQLCWVRTGGGGSTDYPLEIAAAGASVVMTGFCNGPTLFGEGQENETAMTGRGICTGSYGSNGELNWARDTEIGFIVNTPGAFGAAGYPDGSVVLTGKFEAQMTFGSGEPNETTLSASGPMGVDDIFLVRYGAYGNLAWAKQAGGQYYDVGLGADRLSDDTIVVAGGFGETAVFGEGEENETEIYGSLPFDDQSPFIGLYNDDGTLAWVRAEPEGDAFLCDLTVGPTGSVLMTGRFYNSVVFGAGESSETVLTADTYYDLFIAKYAVSGTLVWATSARGIDTEESYAVAVGADESVIATGSFETNAIFGEGEPNETTLSAPAGEEQLFVASYEPDGTLTRAVAANSTDDNSATGVAILADGSVLVTGWIYSETTFGQGEANEVTLDVNVGRAVFLARYNSGLELEWCVKVVDYEAQSSVKRERRLSRVAVLADGSVYVAGRFAGNGIVFGEGEPNETTLSSFGNFDYFIARYAP
jgi:hypothetical protein